MTEEEFRSELGRTYLYQVKHGTVELTHTSVPKKIMDFLKLKHGDIIIWEGTFEGKEFVAKVRKVK
jgi:hypothetical protein